MPRQSSILTLEHVLLALLDEKPMHGYELYQELCSMDGISLIWNIKQALLYAILAKLEKNGLLSSKLVQGESYPPRNYFDLTNLGRSSLHTWTKTPVRRARDLRQEFLAKLIIARRYGKANALELVHAQEQACETWLDELRATLPPDDGPNRDAWVVYSFRINRVEAVLKWLDSVEHDLIK